MRNTVRECNPLGSTHVPELLNSQASIQWVLSNIDPPSLQCTPPHLCVQGKVAKPGMPGKATVPVHHQVLEVVTNGDRAQTWSSEVGRPNGKESWEGTCEVAIRVEFVDGCSTYLGPRDRLIITVALSHSLLHNLTFRVLPMVHWNKTTCQKGIVGIVTLLSGLFISNRIFQRHRG